VVSEFLGKYSVTNLFPTSIMAAPLGGSVSVGPIINTAGPGEPFFAPASGGGGGGGGPDLSVSTLTSQSTITAPLITGTFGSLSFVSPGSGWTTWTGPNGTFIKQNDQKVIEINGSTSAPGTCLFNNFSDVNMGTTNLQVSSINGAEPGGAGTGPNPVFSTVTTQLDATIGGTVACAGVTVNGANATTTTLAVNASNYLSVANGVNTGNIAGCAQIANGPNPVSISSLNVSSINGAGPGGGGGGGPNLNVSTINVNPTGLITFVNDSALDSQGIQYNIDPAGTSSFVQGITYLSNEGGGGTGIGVATKRNDGAINSYSGTVVTELHFSDPTFGTNPQAIMKKNATDAGVYVSSMWVSSINGAGPGGGGSVYPIVSTIQPGGPSGTQTQYFVSTGASAQVLTPFSTVVGHNYMLSIPFSASTFQAPVYGECLQFTSAGPGAQDLQCTVPLIQDGQWNFPISFKNKIGNAGVAFLIAANTSYPVGINLGDQDGGELVDLGPSQ
jgi:hypothetical protein